MPRTSTPCSTECSSKSWNQERGGYVERRHSDLKTGKVSVYRRRMSMDKFRIILRKMVMIWLIPFSRAGV